MRHAKFSAAVLVLAIAVLAGAVLYWNWPRRAPDVEFRTIAGERFRLRDWYGHPTLVAFWASDCRGCMEELGDLLTLHREFAARGLHLVIVAMPYDLPNRVVATARSQQIPFPVALDPLGKVTEAFGRVQWVPNSFLIDPEGRIAMNQLGRLRAEELRAPIELMLGAI